MAEQDKIEKFRRELSSTASLPNSLNVQFTRDEAESLYAHFNGDAMDAAFTYTAWVRHSIKENGYPTRRSTLVKTILEHDPNYFPETSRKDSKGRSLDIYI